MERWIDFGHESTKMAIFSAPHCAALGVILLLCFMLILCRNAISTEKSKQIFRYIFAAVIIIQQLSLYAWYTVMGEWSVEVTLPLQLCDLSVFLSIAVLLTKRQLPFELLYYWGLGGATQAILTPDNGSYNFPHFIYYQFFLAHGAILLACIYMIAVEKFRPSRYSVFRTLLITNLYAALIFPFNLLTGANYLFINHKPADGTLFDLLGPWPWYILSLEAVALLVFTILYLPFAKGGTGTQRRDTGISA